MNARMIVRTTLRPCIVVLGIASLGLGLAACQSQAELPATAPEAADLAAAVTPAQPLVAATVVQPQPKSAVKALPLPGGPAMLAVATDQTLGDHLVDAAGMTVYMFVNDSPNLSTCSDDCSRTWPPVLTSGAPEVGEGVDGGLVGTAEREDGSNQVTYNGWPVYYFALDEAPGDINGQGIGDVWFAISPAGEKIVVD